jgi:hypothetical protein
MRSVAYIKRLLAGLGMVLLAPIAAQLATGRLTPVDAAIRAALLFVALVVIRSALTRLGRRLGT